MKKIKYDKIDSVWLDKFWEAMKRQNRACQMFRKDHDCGCTVFVRRVLRKVEGYYTVIHGVETGALEPAWPGATGFDYRPVTIPRKLYVYVAMLRYRLDWSTGALEALYCTAHPGRYMQFHGLDYNHLRKLQFKRITTEAYMKVQNMFAPDNKEEKDEK